MSVPTSDSHDPYLAFRFPAYRVFAASHVLAVISSQMLSTSVQWHIFHLTGSMSAMATLGLINALPIVGLALSAGHAADTYSRKKILVVTQLFLIAMPWLLCRSTSHDTADPLTIFSLVGVNAVALAFARPARAALLINLVPREAYRNLISWNSTIFETSSMVGPALGGLVLATLGVRAAYFVAGASMLACFALTLKLPDHHVTVRNEPLTIRTLSAGLKFVFSQQLLWASMLLDLLAVLLGGATYLLPAFAEQRLFVNEFGFGVLKAAPALGAGLMALYQAHRPPFRRAGRTMMWAVAGFSVATIAFGFSTNFWFSLLMLFTIGMCDNVSVVLRHTIVQTLTPDAKRGRVAAVNQIFIGASNDLGGYESGKTAEWFGLVGSVVGGGVGALVVTAVIAAMAPKLRRLNSLQELKEITEADHTLPA